MIFARRVRFCIAVAPACAMMIWMAGCRQNVYHELYAEQNAREIRALEDRIFEYDAEYRALEQELWAAEKESEDLKRRLELLLQNPSSKSSRKPSQSPPPPESIPSLEDSWQLPDVLHEEKKTAPSKEDKKKSEGTNPPKSEGLKIVDPAPTSEGVEQIPPPKTPPNNSNAPGNAGGAAPNPTMANPGSNNNLAEPVQPQNTPSPFGLPQLKPGLQPGNSPGLTPPPFAPQGGQGQGAPNNASPFQPPATSNDRNREQTNSSNNRIVVPELDSAVRQATALTPVLTTVEKKDTRITGIFFHPSLCRGINFDDSPEDDGVYLVLQPQNGMGEFVAEGGEVTIIAVDPTRPKDQERIGRWTYGSTEMPKLLHEAGTSKGYHLPLRWQADTPRGDHVQIYVRYVLPNGKTLVAERKIMLHLRDSMQSVWTPRAASK